MALYLRPMSLFKEPGKYVESLCPCTSLCFMFSIYTLWTMITDMWILLKNWKYSTKLFTKVYYNVCTSSGTEIVIIFKIHFKLNKILNSYCPHVFTVSNSPFTMSLLSKYVWSIHTVIYFYLFNYLKCIYCLMKIFVWNLIFADIFNFVKHGNVLYPARVASFIIIALFKSVFYKRKQFTKV